MSFTATATRERVSSSLNLVEFSHPPVKQKSVSGNGHVPAAAPAKTDSPPAQLSDDDEDVFNLDMVTMDMNFEQAYSMYTQLQQKNALLEVEHLQQAQQLNHKQAGAGGLKMEPNRLFLNEPDFQQQSQYHRYAEGEWDPSSKLYPGDYSAARFYADAGVGPSTHLGANTQPSTNVLVGANTHAGQIGALPGMGIHAPHAAQHGVLDGGPPRMPPGPLISPPGEAINGIGLVCGTQHAPPAAQKELFTNEVPEDTDQFFSTTESSALDRFLDNLAFSSEVNPLEFYHQSHPRVPHMFEMRTMQQQQEPFAYDKDAERDAEQARYDGPAPDLKSFVFGESPNPQLRTPDTSVGQVPSKRVRQDSACSEGSLKRRKSAKPLLSQTQKKLNHSSLEQKRRLLCKEAYDRCLRLVTNVDDYKNMLVSASGGGAAKKKKSKRKQLTKDGLPNLSKHSALQKISGEICKIQGKNAELRRLLGEL